MSKERKKVLIITYYFPPSGGAGVQRTLKFVKYLREFGWEPVILTARNADYPAYDESLWHEVPAGIKVYRSRIFEPYRLYRKFTGRKPSESTDIASLSLGTESKHKFSERVSEWIRAAIFVPDARIGWLLFAFFKGREAIKKEGIQILHSSAPPYTTHLIGRMLKWSSKLPWIVDFRDSWIGWVSTPPWRPKFSRAIEMRMEASVLRYADRILTVTDGIQEDLLKRHPEHRDDRWRLLANGFDAADFSSVEPVHGDDKLTITYSGSLYGPRNPKTLIKAIEILQKENPEMLRKLRIRVIGRVGESVMESIRQSTVQDNFEVLSYMPHKDSLAYLLGSDVSLLIVDESSVNDAIIPGKIYEYIGAGHPILALAPEGEVARLVKNDNLGYVVAPNDIDGLKELLVKLLNDEIDLKCDKDSEFYKKYERRERTRELAKIFDELIFG